MRSARSEVSDAAAGSVLVEALVGISMLVAMTTALLAFSSSWLEATESSKVRTDGLALAVEHLAHEVLAPSPEEPTRATAVHPVVGTVLSSWEGSPALADICGVSGPRPIGGPVVAAARIDDAERPVLRLMATRLEAPRASAVEQTAPIGGGSLSIEGAGVEGQVVAMHTDAAQVERVVDPDGCLRLPDLRPGRHTFIAGVDGGGSTLIDEWHRSGAALRIERSVLDRAALGSWVVSTPAHVSVDADASGARMPDVVRRGSLRWLVRGDASRDARDLGATRELHPGRLSIVVSSCVNPEAYGSSTTLEVSGGEDVAVSVPLAVVTLEGLADRRDDAISAVRVTGCSDGSGLRPTVRWEGDLSDGMRVALPHGDWEVSVQTIAGARITSPVLMRAGAADERVRFP